MRNTISSVTVLLIATALLLVSAQAYAAGPKLLSTHGDWAAYSFAENGKTVCYMATQPKKAEGNYTKRGDVFAFVTHRPAEGANDVFSYMTGYTYKPNSNVTVKIGSQKFTLFTQGDMAWASDAETDRRLSSAIRNGNTMVVKGTSSRGTLTTDTFSLRGTTAAYNKISKACGLK